MRERLVRELRGTLDVLVIEGTNLGRAAGDFPSEVSVEEHAVKVARSVDSLVMVAFSPQNLDRFVSFFRAAVRTGRTFVCDHYMAAVLYMIAERSLPKPAANGKLRVYFPRRRKRVEKLERKARASAITLHEIRATPEKFMMLARPSLIEDFEGNLPERTRLLFGMWAGYREKLEWRNTERLITAAGGDIQDCHASGHAHAEDLFRFIEELHPVRLIPIHTLNPELYEARYPELIWSNDTPI
jgi:ribonuclease J